MPLPVLSSSGRLFAAAAFLEGLTWAGLLVGMWLKYGLEVTDTGVWLFGRLHGTRCRVGFLEPCLRDPRGLLPHRPGIDH